jgi:hypothetical protein
MEKYQQVEYVNFIKDLCETRDRNLAAINLSPWSLQNFRYRIRNLHFEKLSFLIYATNIGVGISAMYHRR